MENLTSPALKATSFTADSHALLASRKHTLYFLLICVVLTTISAMNATSSAHSQDEMIQIYLFVIGMQCLWVRFIYKGMQKYARSIFEFFGAKKITPAGVLKDFTFAALALALIYVISTSVTGFIQHGAASSNALLPTFPTGLLAVTVWICLSLSAGICEEIVFRGYLQRQLTAITGNVGIAIVAQSLIFGIAHAYEGVGAVVDIVFHGAILGLLAAWRGNIRACMIEHAAWDILAGFGIV